MVENTKKLRLIGAQRETKTVLDTIQLTPAIVGKWKLPPFQRPLKVNAKVVQVAEQIKCDGGVIPGVLTLGMLNGDTYLLDGQHRREAFVISGLEEGYADIRRHQFTDMGEMGEEFVRLNSQLVRMTSDDILRGLEGSSKTLAEIRAQCPFVGYDSIRRNNSGPIISMAVLLRCWFSSGNEAPSRGAASVPLLQMPSALSDDEVAKLIRFIKLVHEAWGRDPEYQRLWGALNLTICMWLWRRTVLGPASPKVRLSAEMFKKGMMSLSASNHYLDWLTGRALGDRDRSPCYAKIKAIVRQRVEQETGEAPKLPQPAWASHSGGR